MKKTLKLAGLLLALAFVVSMLAITAYADTTYSITVNVPEGSDAGETYNAWQILSIETFTTTTGSEPTLATATYKVATGWADFFSTGAGKDYFTVDGSNYVTVKEGVTLADDSDAMKALAKAAVAYAKTNSATISAVDTKTLATDATTVVLSVPGAGWYAVDSTVGSICMIDNAYPNATIDDKNNVPTVVKTVEGDDTTTASVGDTVDYSVTVTLVPGQTKAIFHDVMETGLAYDSTTLAVKVGGSALDAANYDTTKAGGDTLTVTFDTDYLAALTAATDVVITYSADITADAIADENGLTNSAKLDYGNSSSTETDVATVYTYGFDLAKYDGNTKKVIDGATFSLWTAATEGTEIPLTLDTNGYYRPAVDTETVSDIPAGVAKVEGLANGEYYLQEENFPAGYTKLASRVKVTIADGDVFFTANAPTAVGSDISSTAGGVLIENKQGSVLPTTGGMGTTLIYIAGAILVIGAGVLLVAKKRMGTAK